MSFIPIVVPGEPRRIIFASHKRPPFAAIDVSLSTCTMWYIFGSSGVGMVPQRLVGVIFVHIHIFRQWGALVYLVLVVGLVGQLCRRLPHVQLARHHVRDEQMRLSNPFSVVSVVTLCLVSHRDGDFPHFSGLNPLDSGANGFRSLQGIRPGGGKQYDHGQRPMSKVLLISHAGQW